MAIHIKVDGSVNTEYNHKGLKQKKKAVDGYIEPVYLQDGRVALINEEGLLRQLDMNEKASEMTGYFLVGDVLILTKEEWSDESV